MTQKKRKGVPYPVNNNVVVRLLDDNAKDSLVKSGGIFIPNGSSEETRTQEVEIVAISPDILVGQNWTCHVVPGDRALIHRGLQGTPITHEGSKYLVIGYVNLICTLP